MGKNCILLSSPNSSAISKKEWDTELGVAKKAQMLLSVIPTSCFKKLLFLKYECNQQTKNVSENSASNFRILQPFIL